MARILLVDDDIAEISAVKRVLARAGHQAVLATNASDALAVIAQATPALALVAATCEGGEALALAHRLAAGDGTPPLPLLLLGTAEGGPEGAVQLARPVDPGQLAEEVIAALARAIRAAPAPRLAASPVARASVPGAPGGRGSATAVPSRTANTSGAGHPELGAAASAAERSRGTATRTATRAAMTTGAVGAGHPERYA